MGKKEKTPFDVITGYSVNEGLDKELRQNEEYIKIQRKIDKEAALLDQQDFTQEQRLLIDRVICAYMESGAHYGRMTYRRGIRDGVTLLREMNLIKAS